MKSATDLRQSRMDFENTQAAERASAAKRLAESKVIQVEDEVRRHLTDQEWQALLEQMQTAAARGGSRYLLARFPSAACTDNGRQINSGQVGWNATLQGRAADIYRFWDRDLRSEGFGLVAEILDFPGGMPGDIGLTVIWG